MRDDLLQTTDPGSDTMKREEAWWLAERFREMACARQSRLFCLFCFVLVYFWMVAHLIQSSGEARFLLLGRRRLGVDSSQSSLWVRCRSSARSQAGVHTKSRCIVLDTRRTFSLVLVHGKSYPRGHNVYAIYSESRDFVFVEKVSIPNRAEFVFAAVSRSPWTPFLENGANSDGIELWLQEMLGPRQNRSLAMWSLRAGAWNSGRRVYFFSKRQDRCFSLSLAFDPNQNLHWWHATARNPKHLQAMQARDVCCYLVMIVRRHNCLLTLHDQPRLLKRHGGVASRSSAITDRPSSSPPARMSTPSISTSARPTAPADSSPAFRRRRRALRLREASGHVRIPTARPPRERRKCFHPW